MVKQNVVLFSFVTLGAIYFLYPDIKKWFYPDPPVLNEPPSAVSDENDWVPKGAGKRQLLSLDINGNEAVTEFSDSNRPHKLNKNRQSKNISKRRKRELHSPKFISWNLTLNVGQYSDSISTKPKVRKNVQLKGKYLGLSVLAEGNGTSESRTDLDEALGSVKHALKRLFNEDADSLEDGITVHVKAGSNNTETWKKIPSSKNKEGKFLPGFFNLGSSSKPQEPTIKEEMDAVGNDPTTLKDSASTEQPTTLKTFTSEKDILIKPPINVTESSGTTTHFTDDDGNIKNETLNEFCRRLIQTVPASPRFVDEFSDNDVGSGEPLAEAVDIASNDSSVATEKPENKRPNWITSILNVIRGNRHNPSTVVPKEPDTPDTETKDERNARLLGLGNLFGGFGSGRSIGENVSESIKFDEISDYESDDPNEVLTIEECESFFRSLPNDAIFSKPNLLDIITNPLLLNQDPAKIPIEVLHEDDLRSNDFRTETSESFTEGLAMTIDENNVQLLTDQANNDNIDPSLLLITPESSVTKSNLNSDFSKEANFIPTTKIPKDSLVSEIAILPVDIFDIQSEEETTEFQDTDTGQIVTTSKNAEEINERFIGGLLGIGSGERSSDVDLQNNERILGFLNLGSGERQLDESNEDFETSETTTHHSNDHLLLLSPDETNPPVDEFVFNTSDSGDQERIFIRFPNFGSGDGRDLDCIDCQTVSPAILNQPVDNKECVSGDCSYLNYWPLNYIKNHDQGVDTDPNYSSNQETSYSNGIVGNKSPVPQKNQSRLFSTLFLSGSGDGDLFGQGTGEINLIHENELTPPPPQRGRGARFNDELSHMNPPNDSEFVSESSNLQPLEDGALTFPSVPNEAEDMLGPNVIDENSHPENVIPQLSSTDDPTGPRVVDPESESKEPLQKLCSSAGECDGSRNERCITVDGIGICDCGRAYVRHPETRKCEVPVTVRTSLRLPGEVFHQDLKDKTSQRFQNKKKDAVDTMWLFVRGDPRLASHVAGVDVASFEAGSLVVNWELSLAASGDGSSLLLEQVDEELKEAVAAQKGKAPLNMQDAVVLAVSAVDPCENSELNFCSQHAKCIRDEENGFRCECNVGYVDTPGNKSNPGEVCSALCTEDFCGDHGFCVVRSDGKRRCLCDDWYLGSKCNISGIVVIAGFSGGNLAVILLVVLLVCLCRRRRRRVSSFYGQNQVNYQPRNQYGGFSFSPRVLESLAMGECNLVSKKRFNTSTPVNATPSLRINNTTMHGSVSLGSDEYDDSTFERTRLQINKSENVSKV